MALALEDAALEEQAVAREVLDVEIHQLPGIDPALVGEADQAHGIERRTEGDDRSMEELHSPQRHVLVRSGNADSDRPLRGVVEVGKQSRSREARGKKGCGSARASPG